MNLPVAPDRNYIKPLIVTIFFCRKVHADPDTDYFQPVRQGSGHMGITAKIKGEPLETGAGYARGAVPGIFYCLTATLSDRM